MKRLLQFGFVIGLFGTIAAAYFLPWFEYTRYRSATQVLANGGRVERFIVQLPADRLDSTVDAAQAQGIGVGLQHFKLRDAEGHVIGVAAKHELAGAETAWLLTIPSRGTIALTSAATSTETVEASVAAAGLGPGDSAEPSLSIDGVAVRSITTTGEFRGIDIDMIETWIVSGVDEDGQVRGTLQLNTVGMLST